MKHHGNYSLPLGVFTKLSGDNLRMIGELLRKVRGVQAVFSRSF